ncbi:MAG: hypothetical protein R6V50_06685 [Thermoplasmatota archaeon]
MDSTVNIRATRGADSYQTSLLQRSMDDWIDDNAVDSLHTELLT